MIWIIHCKTVGEFVTDFKTQTVIKSTKIRNNRWLFVCCWVLGWMLSRVEQDKCCNANTFCRYKLKQKIGTVAILECSNVYVFLDYK